MNENIKIIKFVNKPFLLFIFVINMCIIILKVYKEREIA